MGNEPCAGNAEEGDAAGHEGADPPEGRGCGVSPGEEEGGENTVRIYEAESYKELRARSAGRGRMVCEWEEGRDGGNGRDRRGRTIVVAAERTFQASRPPSCSSPIGSGCVEPLPFPPLPSPVDSPPRSSRCTEEGEEGAALACGGASRTSSISARRSSLSNVDSVGRNAAWWRIVVVIFDRAMT